MKDKLLALLADFKVKRGDLKEKHLNSDEQDPAWAAENLIRDCRRSDRALANGLSAELRANLASYVDATGILPGALGDVANMLGEISDWEHPKYTVDEAIEHLEWLTDEFSGDGDASVTVELNHGIAMIAESKGRLMWLDAWPDACRLGLAADDVDYPALTTDPESWKRYPTLKVSPSGD